MLAMCEGLLQALDVYCMSMICQLHACKSRVRVGTAITLTLHMGQGRLSNLPEVTQPVSSGAWLRAPDGRVQSPGS